MSPKDDDELKGAKRLNRAGTVLFALIAVIFQFIFWIVALKEFYRPAEEYIHIHKKN